MKKTSNKRSTFLINPQFQISVIKQMFALTCVVIGIFYAANFYHFWTLEQQGLALDLPATHVFFRFIAEQRQTMNIIFLVTALVTLLAIVGFGLMLSHRVAGPLYRMKQYLLDPASNTPSAAPLKFRDNDHFPELAEALNTRLGKSDAASASKP